MSTRMPKLGETVIFFPNPDDTVARSNGATECPAIVTRPWSAVVTNLKLIPDHGPMQDRGSVSHWSANPAGYHFMYMDEYEWYQNRGEKDWAEFSTWKQNRDDMSRHRESQLSGIINSHTVIGG